MLHMKKEPGLSPMPKPAGRQRWMVLGLLCLIALVNNIDRLTLSIAAPAMQHELGFTATDIGLLGSAFSLFYAFGQLPSGWFVDRFGPRKLLGASIVVWSAATAAMGTAHSFGAFLFEEVGAQRGFRLDEVRAMNRRRAGHRDRRGQSTGDPARAESARSGIESGDAFMKALQACPSMIFRIASSKASEGCPPLTRYLRSKMIAGTD
ncbi:MFS transporter [Caballeronia sp. LZ034LL]|uniref:MFS transporter n=1 Tax=Caballeronia sp. LZ034LL TaxID=3038567 RepID=UPI00285E705D|nr:MFS transporter [Caballeronia sp. LZ034LL]MDR5837036.1 MFS transporter [Caballeronia sp. LZ034LL]